MNTAIRILTAVMMVMGMAAFSQNSGDFVIPFSDPAKPGKIYVDIKTGSVTIKGTARKDVSVTYKKDGGDDNDDRNSKSGRDGLKRISSGSLDIEASEYQNTVKIISDNWSEGLELIIEVPSTLDVKAKAYNDGDVTVTGISGELELINYNGSISASGISGSVLAQTYNGDIKISFDKLKADAPMSFINYNGDIDVTFPASLKASLKLKTKQGEIYTGFDGTVQKSNPVTKSDSKSGANKIIIDDWTKMDVSGGGPEITLKSYNGDIYVRKK